jgi:hypothetical protein
MKSAAKDPDSKEEPLELTRETFVGEETIKISGQIDRVDVARDNTIIAYDYKLSTGSSRSDIISGRSLAASDLSRSLEKIDPAGSADRGGGYYVIRGAQDRRNKGSVSREPVGLPEPAREELPVSLMKTGSASATQVVARVWDFLDGMPRRTVRSSTLPSVTRRVASATTAAVCRYDRDRIDRKKEIRVIRG